MEWLGPQAARLLEVLFQELEPLSAQALVLLAERRLAIFLELLDLTKQPI